ncbi:oligosaccharide flippase family protein [Pseudoduganella sp. FT26W]|uniref:Oligosaccharide flippase family protein n=1 Tax=Duganella aquatilis TaxID=2666082 RepID=A0A844D0I5_9BURK|nr:oligosaccharide flippase family protein [Duganella aquatilis]MRW86273.1 oligosaccharide flippase family protein [Duganella aquatilis]
MKTIFATSSMLARILSQTLVFLLIGKVLGPVELGQFSLFMVYASLIGLVADYGCSNPALREMSVNVPGAAGIMNDYLVFRVAMGVVCYTIGGVGLYLSGLVSLADVQLFLWLSLASFVALQSDFILLIFRATTRYNEETVTSIVTALVHLLLVGTVCFVAPHIVPVTMAFLASRLFALAFTVFMVRRKAAILSFASGHIVAALRAAPGMLRKRTLYAADSFITAAFGQIDTLLVGHLLGLHALGNYQLGAKVLQMSLSIVQVASSVCIPVLSRAVHQAHPARTVMQMILALAGVGAAAAGCIYWIMPYLVDRFMGAQFADANVLWGGIGLAVFIRCLAASFGILLVALDKPGVRTFVQIGIISGLVALSWVLVPAYGLWGMGYAVAGALGIGLVIYFVAVLRLAPELFMLRKAEAAH